MTDVPFPLVILDCDGTLVDSHGAIQSVMCEVFAAHGLMPPDAASVRNIVGLQLDYAIERLVGGRGDIAALTESYRVTATRVREAGGFDEPLFPGARAAIAELSDAGCVLGIATGKSTRGLVHTLQRHKIDRFFTTLQTSDTAPGKPHPGMLANAMRETGAEARATVMVGDTSYDMEMARNAGTYAIGVSWGYHDADALAAAGAHLIVDGYDELIGAVRSVLGLDSSDGRVHTTEIGGSP